MAITTTSAALKEASPDQFRPGDIWESPRGTVYKCTETFFPGQGKEGDPSPRRGTKKAVLRQGEDGSGKRVLRDWDAIGTIDSGQFWVRRTWGGNQ